ncbi:FHA domain-containing protein [Cryobacterium sp. GrIS_2_6]|uniref:FHA domain-containing protein n=1 Tax=Cryobacterium sp. GrIS_2_6 TaxID=3162785 RepID=UPI002E028310|nr:FHA domain-containing protein [Cryobacterium psychrotolerans]MEC5148629.1 putative component of type VI protein secretion system [Cryobacterium psychrotolerans]
MNCLICGAPLSAGAMFCGECGSSTKATPKTRKRHDPRPNDTTIIQPLRPRPTVVSIPVTTAAAGPGVLGKPGVSAPPVAVPSPEPEPEPEAEAEAETEIESSSPFAPGRRLHPVTPTRPSRQGAHTHASHVALTGGGAPTAVGAFVLQFSTGEDLEVCGTGLIGRRPMPQPSEHFDRLVQIIDPGMSVSKTHLEFGQHDGELWVNDRFSGNGTVIRRPDATMVRCEPGRRYLVPRGSRVEIGDQYFQVS